MDIVADVLATGQPLSPTSTVSTKTEPYAGWAIYYYRCTSCFFTFTRAFDDWTTADFARNVYNADYPRHDPDYLESRPTQYSQYLNSLFAPWNDKLAILDYGSGSGLLQKKLEVLGFTGVQSYDPFTNDLERPNIQFDLAVCVEVFEHVLDPLALMKDLTGCLKPDGAILFSTLCCPQEVIDRGFSNWWYCAPRNGHISFYSPESLALLAAVNQLTYRRLTDYLHVIHHREVPAWLSQAGLA